MAASCSGVQLPLRLVVVTAGTLSLASQGACAARAGPASAIDTAALQSSRLRSSPTVVVGTAGGNVRGAGAGRCGSGDSAEAHASLPLALQRSVGVIVAGSGIAGGGGVAGGEFTGDGVLAGDDVADGDIAGGGVAGGGAGDDLADISLPACTVG